MESAGTAGASTPPNQVRMRAPWRDAASTWPGGLLCVLFTVPGVIFPAVPWPVYAMTAATAVLVVASTFWVRSFGVELTEQGAVVRGPRTLFVPWRDVQAVLQTRELGHRRVALLMADGRLVTLRAPSAFLGWGARDFEQGYDLIAHWWLRHRGSDWRPLLPQAPG